MAGSKTRWITEAPDSGYDYDWEPEAGREVVWLSFKHLSLSPTEAETDAAVRWAEEERGLTLTPIKDVDAHTAHYAYQRGVQIESHSTSSVLCYVD